ncbi:MAG: hypothetical protein DRQ01_05425 [Ignavibacteriae bacterium]|nr:MAG: hypothetical protein DRQ01_05425 [Ignavibacteriota bacterium]
MFCTECGQKNSDTATFCLSCGKPLDRDVPIIQTPAGGMQGSINNTANNSGQGKMAALPPELTGWNWGGFFLTWIWGIGNSTFIAFLAFIPFVNIVMIFVLGAKGNEWAWQNKRWNSIEHFKKVQKLWAIWGTVLFALWILFILIIIIAAMAAADPYYYEY